MADKTADEVAAEVKAAFDTKNTVEAAVLGDSFGDERQRLRTFYAQELQRQSDKQKETADLVRAKQQATLDTYMDDYNQTLQLNKMLADIRFKLLALVPAVTTATIALI